MSGTIVFDFPLGWLAAVPVGALWIWSLWRGYRRRTPWLRLSALGVLRLVPLAALVFLAAKPAWVTQEPRAPASRGLVMLMDRSESMSLQEQGGSRYEQALNLVRNRLLPAFKSAGIPVQAMLFDQAVEPADGSKLAAVAPKGKRTNLGGAIAQAVGASAQPPLAVLALTDGVVNENGDNARGLTALVDAHVPFIGVGLGSDQGVRTLSLREVEAPSMVSTHTSFCVGAQIESMNGDEMPGFDLVLFRDGQMVQKKSVVAGHGSRTWLENFQVNEDKQGVHKYTVQLMPPNLPNLKCLSLVGNASVRISDEKELRVLYVQGALTWDYKFINIALRNDPTIKLTGLTRTSKQSVFRQNVENAGEFLNGFPTSLEELAPFRVVVLSNLRPADLTVPQQEVLSRFCGELGGGVLMIGGASTFDSSWQHSRLEQLLPVVFSGSAGVLGLDRPFRIQLTEDALQQPFFQIADNQSVRESWSQLPSFTQYGRVDAAKPGAQIWMLHQADEGPRGRRILMASQRYGAGLSAVLTIQNFWRWRLARDSEPQQFDRFWRQLFRYLSEVGRQDVSITLADQELHPQMDVQVTVERQPNPKNVTDTNRKFFVRVEDGRKGLVAEQALELEPLHPVDFKFRAEKPDVYTVSVTDSMKVPVSTRPIEIRDVNVEFQTTARDMESLRQWATVSDGLAFKAEDCPAGADLVAQIRKKIEEVRVGRQVRRTLGVNVWMLGLLLGSLSAEWVLRKRWGLL